MSESQASLSNNGLSPNFSGGSVQTPPAVTDSILEISDGNIDISSLSAINSRLDQADFSSNMLLDEISVRSQDERSGLHNASIFDLSKAHSLLQSFNQLSFLSSSVLESLNQDHIMQDDFWPHIESVIKAIYTRRLACSSILNDVAAWASSTNPEHKVLQFKWRSDVRRGDDVR